MNQVDVREWLMMLPTRDGDSIRRCKNNNERAAVITDLLKNANKDRMTEEDRQICREALVSL